MSGEAVTTGVGIGVTTMLVVSLQPASFPTFTVYFVVAFGVI